MMNKLEYKNWMKYFSFMKNARMPHLVGGKEKGVKKKVSGLEL
jgi:hypothetical protein